MRPGSGAVRCPRSVAAGRLLPVPAFVLAANARRRCPGWRITGRKRVLGCFGHHVVAVRRALIMHRSPLLRVALGGPGTLLIGLGLLIGTSRRTVPVLNLLILLHDSL